MGSLRRLKRRATREVVREDCWIAARRKLPAYVKEGDEAYRPMVVLWLDPREGIVAFELVQGDGERELVQLFQRAVTEPMVGPPRRPARVRVEEPGLAGVLRHGLGGALPVSVGPAPMVDELMAGLFEHLGRVAAELPGPQRGYVEGAGLGRSRVRELFVAAEVLFRAAPWQDWADSELIAIDVPELGVEEACLVVMGMLGESFGFLLFPSLAAYEAFNQMAQQRQALDEELDADAEVDFATDFLSLNYAPLAELAPQVRTELARERWPMAAANAYPVVERRDRNAHVMPLVERDVRIATAVADALAGFFSLRRAAVAEGEEVSMTIETEAGPGVRLTLPYEAKAAQPATGRTAPASAQGDVASSTGKTPRAEPARLKESQRHPIHAIDERLARLLLPYGLERFGKRMKSAWNVMDDGEGLAQFIMPWSLYGHLFDEHTISDWYLSEHSGRLSREERAWLEAQRHAWLGIWKVEAVENERGVHVSDALSGQQRFVHEVAASRVVQPSHHVLARVVELAGEHVFCGMHPQLLRSPEAAPVLAKARKYLRAAGDVEPSRLREQKTARALIRYWQEAALAIAAQRERPLELMNSHGEALLWTIDHYRFAPADRPAIERALRTFAREPSPVGKETRFEVLSSETAGNVVIGTLTLGDDKLRVEANSAQRADDLRERIDELLGPKLRHAARTHSDPLSAAQKPAPPSSGELPPEAHEALRAFKAQHYATWPDIPVPALSGQTPRRAVKTQRGRALVSALLEDMERMERMAPPSATYDFSGLKAELGL